MVFQNFFELFVVLLGLEGSQFAQQGLSFNSDTATAVY